MKNSPFIISNKIGLAFIVIFTLLTHSQAKYNITTSKQYKPKTDSVSYQDRASQFQNGIITSNIGHYTSYLGTATLLVGALLKNEPVMLAGAGTLGLGLPLIGFGSMYMRSSIHSEATMQPNGFPWYFTSLVMGGAYYYGLKEHDLSIAIKVGGGIVIGSVTLAAWKKFLGFKNLLAKRHSEYTLSMTPLIYLAQKNNRGAGLQTTLQF